MYVGWVRPFPPMTDSTTDERADTTIIASPTPNTTTNIDVSECSFNPSTFKSRSNHRLTNKRDHYNYLNEIDQGRKNGPNWDNSRLLTYEENKAVIKAIAAQLELSTPQREVAVGEFMNLDLQKIGESKDWVALAVCAYVVKSDDRNRERKTHPACSKSEQDTLFVDMVEAVGLTDSRYHSMYGKVASKLPDKPSRHHRPPWEVSDTSWKRQKEAGAGGGGT